MPDRGLEDGRKKLTPAECDAYTLCQLLGRWDHPDDMVADLTAEQYDGWLLWLAKYHPTPDRDDPMWAMLLSMTHNQWAEGSDRVTPREMMLYLDPYEEEITAEELLRRIGI